MQFPLSVELHRSKLLFFLLVLIHGTAGIAACLLPWSPSWRVVVVLLVALSLVRALRPPRIVGLRLLAHDRLECRLADGRWVGAVVQAESSVFAQLIVLRLRLDEGEEGGTGGEVVSRQRRCALVILPDQLGVQDFRRLRVCLRWAVGGESAAKPPAARNDVGGPAV